MDEKPRSVSAEFTLFDDESTRKKSTVMTKFDVMTDDSRNDPEDGRLFGDVVEDFLEWGKTYRVIVEEVE